MRSKLSSVANAIEILKAFSDDNYEMGITELANRLGLAKSSVHRLTATLVEARMLTQNQETQKYRLGMANFELGALVRRKMDVAMEAKEWLMALREQTGETAQLAIISASEIIYVNYFESQNSVRLSTALGLRKPAFCTAEGKAILASQLRDNAERLKGIELERRTPNTIANLPALQKELAMVRMQGFAIDDEESEIGMRCIAAPIRHGNDHVSAAIGIAGPVQRLSKKLLLSFRPLLINATEEISLRLGAPRHARRA